MMESSDSYGKKKSEVREWECSDGNVFFRRFSSDVFFRRVERKLGREVRKESSDEDEKS